MTAPRPSVPLEVLHELRHGHKLEAIRLLRGATGMGLKEAKDTIEALEHAPLAAMQPRAAAQNPQSLLSLPPAVVQALQEGRQVQAIRILREHTGMGLKDAVDTIKAQVGAMPTTVLAPGEQGHSKDQLWWLVLCALLAALAGIWLWG
jgi:ribosomal protein L7/L12